MARLTVLWSNKSWGKNFFGLKTFFYLFFSPLFQTMTSVNNLVIVNPWIQEKGDISALNPTQFVSTPLDLTNVSLMIEISVTAPLCYRNFQNVKKLRLDFIEIWSFYRQSESEIQFWWIQTVQKCYFWQFYRIWTLNFGKFGTWKLLKFIKNQNSEPLKLPKMTFIDLLNSLKFEFP